MYRTAGRGVIIEGPSGIGKTTCVLKILEELSLLDKVTKLSGRKKEDVELIQELPIMQDIGIVLIDDFHKIEDPLKNEIADLIKRLSDEESEKNKVIVIGINKAGNSLINFAPDLIGRLDIIPFESNPIEKIIELIEKGEKALKININVKADIAEHAYGSFHIAQMLCYEICLLEGILEERASQTEISTSIEHIIQKVVDNLSTLFFSTAKLFATGPRLRREGRAPYFFLLLWLSKQDEWTLDIDNILRENPTHKGSITQIVEKGYLSEFVSKHTELQDVFHFESQTKLLSIEDPKFAFFLRNILWNKFAKQLGYTTISFDSHYDFALSFAGKDREIAEMIFNNLTDEQMEVFYDKNEQHRMLANNIEDYLAPIYRSEATFIIVLLGKEYPKRIWTKFESEQFKKRFGENAVIPIWFSDAEPGMFDETTKVGGIEFDVNADMKSQVDNICSLLIKKINEERK